MTSHGTAYGRFRRAISQRNVGAARAAAAELPTLGLADALALTLLFLPHDSATYERAIVRWQARYLSEQTPPADEAVLVFAALRALSGRARGAAAEALIELFETHGPRAAARVLERWLEAP